MPRRPRDPCAGGCGKLLWDSSTSLPAGQRTCQPCRRVNPLRTERVYPRKPERTVACARCGGAFTTTYSKQRFCSTQCRQRTSESKRSTAITKARRSKAYRDLRALVLAEEPDCWLCNQPIGAEPWPDAMSGTIDHIIPVSVDPTRILDRANVHTAHLQCNSRRTDYQFGKRMLVA